MSTTQLALHSKVLPILTSLSLIALPVLAETVIVESRTAGGTAGGITPSPPYTETAGSWSGSGSHTSAGGTTAGIGSRYAYAGIPSVRITPTLIPGATYLMAISHISGNGSPNLVVTVTYSGCSGSTSSTTAFNTSVASPNWETIGTITVDAGVTQPSITFTYASGTLGSQPGRWYMDAI